MRKYWRDDEKTYLMNISLHKILGIGFETCPMFGRIVPYTKDKQHIIIKAMIWISHL